MDRPKVQLAQLSCLALGLIPELRPYKMAPFPHLKQGIRMHHHFLLDHILPFVSQRTTYCI